MGEDFNMPRKKCIEIVLDVETTGLDYKKERIIEFAAVRLENGVIKDKYETLKELIETLNQYDKCITVNYNTNNDNLISYRFSANNLKKDGKILNVPLYFIEYIDNLDI